MQAVPQAIVERVSDHYRDRRVLVTGGMSFIGSHLVEALLAAGARVVVADDLSSGLESNLAEVRDQLTFLKGDLRDPTLAERACADVRTVFHLASAHGGRGYIETHPVELMNNLVLDHVVFAAAARAGVTRIISASTACVYPINLQSDEESRLLLMERDANFDEPGKAFADGEYGWAKLMGEMQLRAFHKARGIDGVACRLFTAYGERENESHAVIALIAKALARMDPYPIWGNGQQTRNFTYVGDTAAGMLLAGALMSGFEAINVGSPEHHTVNHLVDLIFDVVGWRPSRIDYQLDKPTGVKSRAASVEKCRRLLGWEPGYGLREGIARTIAWYESTVDRSTLDRLEEALMERRHPGVQDQAGQVVRTP